MKRRSRPISSRISAGRPRPVLGAEGEDGQVFDAEFAGRAHGAAQGLDAAAVALDARQAARRRPAAVAVHDDGDVRAARRLPAGSAPAGPRLSDMSGYPQTVRISFSLAASIWSISAMMPSVAFCISRGKRS